MGKALEKLRSLVNESFKEVSTPEKIKEMARYEEAIKEAEAEEKALIDSQAELVKDYKELVMSQGTSKPPVDEGAPSGKSPSFDSMLKEFEAKQTKENDKK